MTDQENKSGILGPAAEPSTSTALPPLDDIRRIVEHVATAEEEDFRNCDDPARKEAHIYLSVVRVRHWLGTAGGVA
jgi:hypothetical protein